MGNNFIGPDEIKRISNRLNVFIPDRLPVIPFSVDELNQKRDEWILILILNRFSDGSFITINSLRNHFGIDPDISEPCFYNQDWYLGEEFVNKIDKEGWLLLKKRSEDSLRALDPSNNVENVQDSIKFMSAISCVYVFFICFLTIDLNLWMEDYIWCSDKDTLNDRIYIGRYADTNALNKKGLEIHRHLRIKNNFTMNLFKAASE